MFRRVLFFDDAGNSNKSNITDLLTSRDSNNEENSTPAVERGFIDKLYDFAMKNLYYIIIIISCLFIFASSIWMIIYFCYCNCVKKPSTCSENSETRGETQTSSVDSVGRRGAKNGGKPNKPSLGLFISLNQITVNQILVQNYF